MRYADFSVQLEASPDGACRARVIGSPAGPASGSFKLPLTRAELDLLAESVAGSVRQRRVAAASRPVAGAPVDVPALREVGARLSRALFSEGVRGCFDESRGRIRGRGGRGLRLRLCLSLDDAANVALLAQPWEFLLQPDVDAFLALGRGTGLVRCIQVPHPAVRRRRLESPLRVLAVPSCPRGLTPLAVDREIADLERSLRGERVSIEVLRPATLDGLRAALRSGFHVLHFAGHGAIDERGDGLVCFSNDAAEPRVVSGCELAYQVRDMRALRLVMLNACDSARASVAAPFAGVATALLQAGVPAVIAMQFSISDDAARTFSAAFYARLAAGDAVDLAVAEARLAVRNRLQGTIEWGTPVLYLSGDADPLVLPAPRPATPDPARRVPRPLAPPRSSPPTTRTLHMVHEQPAEVPELGATVVVEFQRVAGQETLRVTLAAPGVTGPPPAPIMGPDTLEFRGAGRVWFVDVIVIAWQTRRVTLRVRAA